jgi:hypothetical protein
MSTTILIRKKPQDVIIIDEDHGGVEAGHCFACGARGWLDGLFGYPYPGHNVYKNKLIHREKCPMNEVLDETGKLLKRKKVISRG